MNQQYAETDPNLTPDQIEAMVNEFFDALEPKPRKGRPWTFERMAAACDDPKGEPIQAVLYPNDGEGFALYARQGRSLHAVTYRRHPVRFRTIEKALTTLADVPNLDPEIVVDASNWREETGPI